MKPRSIQELYEAQYNQAEAAVKPRPDGTRDVDAVLSALADLQEIDVEREKRKKAKMIFDSLKDAEGTTRKDGQLLFAFLSEPYDYKPDQLIVSAGMVVRNEFAPLAFKVDHLSRAQQKISEQQKQADREQQEVNHFQAWSKRELEKGRPVLDLTWGNCVRENTFWIRK